MGVLGQLLLPSLAAVRQHTRYVVDEKIPDLLKFARQQAEVRAPRAPR
jgi:hypothetical protein